MAFTCDTEKMFHNFRVNIEHRDFLRFLWFEGHDLNGRILEFRMNVHLFGTKSSPAVANFCLHKTTEVGPDNIIDENSPLHPPRLHTKISSQK